MNKTKKFLKGISQRERDQIEIKLKLLFSGKLESLDIKKLKGFKSIYRIRIGTIRIIFKKEGSAISILEMAHRDESTYKSY